MLLGALRSLFRWMFQVSFATLLWTRDKRNYVSIPHLHDNHVSTGEELLDSRPFFLINPLRIGCPIEGFVEYFELPLRFLLAFPPASVLACNKGTCN